MYSPKISEELIPDLYQMAKAEGTKMTKLVNRMLEAEIKKHKREEQEHGRNDNSSRRRVSDERPA
jgi:post-segregation antitoxin (ccd killing protein)